MQTRHELMPQFAAVLLAFGLIASLLPGFFAAPCLAQAPAAQPMKIIFDSDMGGDTDDGGTAAMLHALQNRGEVEVIACIFCTGTGAEYNEFGAGFWDAINHYYNRGDIPIGANKIPNENREGGAKPVYGFKDVESIAKNTALYGHKIVSSKELPSAIEVYRRALAEAEDGSVTILTVGEVNVIPRLLDSPADEVSPLTGYQLVARKCSRIVSMGPPYNWGTPRLHDPLPPNGWGWQMLQKLPPNIPVYASPEGGQVKSGMSLYKTPVNNPVRENYRITKDNTIGPSTSHHSMDQCAAYYAVRGAQTGLQRVTAHGSWVLGAGFNTYNVWNSNINNPMHFKVDAISNSDLGKAIDELMGELPIAISITSPRGGEAWEAGAKHDIKWTTKGDIPRVSIAYTTDGAAWKKIADSLANTGSYTWTVPKDGSATVRLKVSAIPEAVMKGVSGQIEIKEPTDR
jgi:hypothetical protein